MEFIYFEKYLKQTKELFGGRYDFLGWLHESDDEDFGEFEPTWKISRLVEHKL